MEEVKVPEGKPIRLLEWLIKEGDWIKYGAPVAVYRHIQDPSSEVPTKEAQLRSKNVGRVKKVLLQIGQVATPGCSIIELESCSHPVVMKEMCAECGQDLRLLDEENTNKYASVSMVPNIPELKISEQQAEELGNQDKSRLHKMRKLVLLVDLDQTLIHTTQNQLFASSCTDPKEFYTFQLQKNEPTLYTKLRPHCREFLEKISQHFELQIVTFGSRLYAHKIAEFIDPKGKYFAHRILSRDECINPLRKSGNLRHLFPCGDSMVCIIDDRDDVWNAIPNVILVKKYSYFPGAGDINTPDKVEANKQKKAETKEVDELKASPRKRRNANKPTDTLCKVMKTSNHESCETMKSSDSQVDKESVVEAKETNVIDTSSDPSSDTVTSSNDDVSPAEEIAPESGDQSTRSTLDNNQVEIIDDTKKQTNSCNNSDNVTSQLSSNNHKVVDSNDSETNISNTEVKTVNNSTTDEGDTREGNIDNEIKEVIAEKSTKDSIEQPSIKLEKDSEVADNDDYLVYLQDVLVHIHKTYYDAYDKFVAGDHEHAPDLRGVVPFLRSKVLFDCHIVLTAVIPSNFRALPTQHKVHVIAKQLGATIDNKVSEKTTHLICGKKGTNKYQDALKLGNIKFVSVDWLWACSERWEKVSEKLFPIPNRFDNNTCSSREGTPPISKLASNENRNVCSGARTYNSVTGKLIKKVKDPRFDFMVTEAVARQQENRRINPLYSSLKDPEVVIPLEILIHASTSEPNEAITSTSEEARTSSAQIRSRKLSMAEMMGIGYSLSSNDIADMDKEVDDLLSSDDETTPGTLIDQVVSSSHEESQNISGDKVKDDSARSDDEDSSSTPGNDGTSSSSEEEFDHMAELLDHEMHYDEDNSDLETLD